MLNPFDTPATIPPDNGFSLDEPEQIANPIGEPQDMGSIEASALAELEAVRKVFLACDKGEYRGPLEIFSPYFFTICCENYGQREALRKAMSLTSHGEQYWAGSAVDGTLQLLLKGGMDSTDPFSGLDAALAGLDSAFSDLFPDPTPAKPKKAPKGENAEKYSNLRAEAKKTAEKMATYTEDRTWIAVCFRDEKDMTAFRKKWGLPVAGKFIHVEDWCAALAGKGITLDVPQVEFALRAEAKPDKALNALVG